jgi:VanZ family protein
MKQLRFGKLWWFGGCVLLAVVVVGCLVPPRDVPNLMLPDKFEHFLAYFGLALWFSGLLERSRYALLWSALFILGGSIELLQAAMGLGRMAEWNDMLANVIGMSAGLTLAWLGLGAWPNFLERAVAGGSPRA